MKVYSMKQKYLMKRSTKLPKSEEGIIANTVQGNPKSNMETFKIEVQEFLSRVVEVNAESRSEAISKINVQYEKTEIVLDYNDFVEVNFLDINSQSPIDEKDKLIKGVIDYLYEDEKKRYEEFEAAPDNHIYLKIKRLNELLNG